MTIKIRTKHVAKFRLAVRDTELHRYHHESDGLVQKGPSKILHNSTENVQYRQNKS